MKKVSLYDIILIFFVCLICSLFLFPVLSLFLDSSITWKLLPVIPIVSLIVSFVYGRF